MEASKTSRFGRKAMSLFLSGAMVVAFAPNVAAPMAEAAIKSGDTVTVKFDAGAGKLVANQEIANATATASGEDTIALTAVEGAADSYKIGDYAVAGWWFDSDGDKKIDNGNEVLEADGSGTLKGTEVAKLSAGGSITVKAIYQAPALADVDLESQEVKQADGAAGAALKVEVNNAKEKIATTVSVVLKKDGSEIGRQSVELADTDEKREVTFTSAGARDDAKGEFAKAAWSDGEFTFELVDGKGNVLGDAESVGLTTLSLQGGEFQATATTKANTVSVKALVGETYAAALQRAYGTDGAPSAADGDDDVDVLAAGTGDNASYALVGYSVGEDTVVVVDTSGTDVSKVITAGKRGCGRIPVPYVGNRG